VVKIFLVRIFDVKVAKVKIEFYDEVLGKDSSNEVTEVV
jgi:hypothetical protein